MRIAVAFLLFMTACAVPMGENTHTPARITANANRTSTAPASATKDLTVTIEALDGVRLVGTLFESPKPNSPALLLLHQWQSDRHSYDDFAKRVQSRGFNVLSIDGRGFGESTKKADGSSVAAGRTGADVEAMLGDVDAAIEFLKQQNNVGATKIGIVGASYGSSLAIMYAADHPDAAAIALLSPGLNYFGNMQTPPAIRKYGNRPLLMVAAEDDKESADAVRELKKADPNDKYQIQIYPNGGHGTNIFNAKVRLEDLLEQFLAASLEK
jgi:pimeloyl-ACP methyl ester carboxylesterase